MTRPDISKIFFYTAFITTALLLTFAYGFYSANNKNAVFQFIDEIKKNIVIVTDEAAVLANIRPDHILQPRRRDGTGVTINDLSTNQTDLILLSGFFDGNNEIRLIRRNGEIIARWPVKFSELFPNTDYLKYPPATDWNTDIHGALALPDGSVVFNFEFFGLVHLDRCGDVSWTLDRMTHHSVERAEGGGLWVAGRRRYEAGDKTPFPPFITPFEEDTILKVSDKGDLLREISVPGLFYNSQLETLLTSSGHSLTSKWDKEIVHLNKVGELTRDIADDFPGFNAGDLVLSLRTYNMLLIVDPVQERIKWWKIGPWIRQHDPQFLPGGNIILFNNNTYGTNETFGTTRYSTISQHNLNTGETTTRYGGQQEQQLFSIIRSKVKHMPHGGLLITEFEGGRALEVDINGQIIWEYINGYNNEFVAEMTEARIYTSDYFSVKDWNCTGK